MLFREVHMEKLTMLDYVKETPGVLRTNIEQYTTLVDPLMKEVQQKKLNVFYLLLLDQVIMLVIVLEVLWKK